MKKGLFICILSFSTQVFAGFPIVNIDNFTGNYSDPSGQATAEDFLYENIDFGKNPSFTVERQAGLINLRTQTEEFTWQNPPEFINELNDLNWKSIQMNSNPDNFSLEVPSFSGNSDKATFSTSNLSLSCEHSGNQLGDLASELMDSCLNHNAQFYTSYINFSNARGTSLNNLSFKVNNNNLTFSVKSGVTVNGYGQIWYEHNNKMVKIRIDRAKAGFLNVRGRLFNELKALESDKIHVNEPWIEIEL